MAFKEIIGSGYVELTADDKKLSAALDRTDKKMKQVEQTALRFGGGLSKAFLGGFGIGSAEQVIGRVASAISDLTGKMTAAANEGKSVGEAIAMWTHETLGLRNAVSDYNNAIRESNELHAINERFQERMLGLAKEDSDLAATRQKQARLEADLRGLEADAKRRLPGWAVTGMSSDDLTGGDSAEKRRGLAMEIERAKRQISEMEKGIKAAEAKIAQAKADAARAAMVAAASDIARIGKSGRDEKFLAMWEREEMDRQRERQRPINEQIAAATKNVDRLEATRPSSGNRFMGIEAFARSIQEGANDESQTLEKQLKVAQDQLTELKEIRKKEFGGAVFQ